MAPLRGAPLRLLAPPRARASGGASGGAASGAGAGGGWREACPVHHRLDFKFKLRGTTPGRQAGVGRRRSRRRVSAAVPAERASPSEAGDTDEADCAASRAGSGRAGELDRASPPPPPPPAAATAASARDSSSATAASSGGGSARCVSCGISCGSSRGPADARAARRGPPAPPVCNRRPVLLK